MSQDAENAGDQVKFKIVDPAHVPSKPTTPNRLIFNTAVLIVAMAGGLGLVFLYGLLFPVVHHHRSLRELTGYPVFGSISMIRKPEALKKRNKEISIYVTSFSMLILTYIVIMIVQIVI